MQKKPKIILWDIETAPYKTYSFNFYYNTNADMIIQEDSLISFAYKELNSKKTEVVSIGGDLKRYEKNPYDDTYVVKKLHEVLSSADAIIHHYGDKFDKKRANDFFIKHGLPPIKDLIQIDTYKILKKHFHLKSNRLDYVGQFLGLGKKIKTSFSLWKRCMEGDLKAVKEMEKYNKQDVNLLEKVYLKLAPYTPAKFNLQTFYERKDICQSCGSNDVCKNGFKITIAGRKQRFLCKGCGHTYNERENIKPEIEKHSFKNVKDFCFYVLGKDLGTKWLNDKNHLLNNKTPKEAIKNKEGLKVKEILNKILYGLQ